MIMNESLLYLVMGIFCLYYREIGGGQGAGVAGVVEGGRGQPPPQGGDQAHLDTECYQNVIELL